MKAFRRNRKGQIHSKLDREEALLLQSLASQFIDLLHNGDPEDSALNRLFPNAYPDDDSASAEFRELTVGGLHERKLANANTVLNSLSASVETGELSLDEPQAQSWLRSLTDIRLTLADRLQIETDDQPPDDENPLQGLYDWLGFLQNSLVDAIEDAP